MPPVSFFGCPGGCEIWSTGLQLDVKEFAVTENDITIIKEGNVLLIYRGIDLTFTNQGGAVLCRP